MERLQKVLAQAGVASRRKSEELIRQGRVKVDGVVITEMGTQVSKKNVILVDDKPIEKESKVYFVLNKPKNVICTNNDDKDRITAASLIDCKERIFPIGRLDYDTTGVLLLTNDGDFTNCMAHPRYHVPKVYDLDIKGILSTEHIKELEKGIFLDGKMTLPAKIKVTNKDYKKEQTTLEIRINEGRYHQVKKMFLYFNYKVTRLHRKSYGTINVNNMMPGEYRILKPFEVKQLRLLANTGSLVNTGNKKKNENTD